MVLFSGAVALGIISAVSALPGRQSLQERALTCSGTFNKLTAADWVKAANPGWNLGWSCSSFNHARSSDHMQATRSMAFQQKAHGDL
jgi:hypothetical protein